LGRDNEFHDPGEPHLQTRGLIDGTIRFADDDVVKLKVLPIYKGCCKAVVNIWHIFISPNAPPLPSKRRSDSSDYRWQRGSRGFGRAGS
jgi:hypothetical protein